MDQRIIQRRQALLYITWMGIGILCISSPSSSKSCKAKTKSLNTGANGKALSTYCSYSHWISVTNQNCFWKWNSLVFWHVLLFIGEGFSSLAHCFFCYISLFHQLYALNEIPIFLSLVCWTTEPGQMKAHGQPYGNNNISAAIQEDQELHIHKVIRNIFIQFWIISLVCFLQ